MLLTELINNIYFHDSCVNKIVFSNKTIIMNIDLCMWKQKGYKKGSPELQEVNVIFSNITNYNWDSDKNEDEIDYDTILQIKMENNKVKIILADEDILKTSIVSILSFECTGAQLNYINT